MPKLNLRDLFWLVLFVAMGCEWWLDRQRFTNQGELLLIGTVAIAVFIGFNLGRLSRESEAVCKTNKLQFRLQYYKARLEQLKRTMKQAGIEIPPREDDEPYPSTHDAALN